MVVMMIAAGEAARAGRGGERPVAPDGEAVAQDVVVDVADGCAAADQELQRPGGRICHLADGDGDGELPQRLSGRLVRLGCGCRGELAAAHRRCAEAWFSVRGNRYVLRSMAKLVIFHNNTVLIKSAIMSTQAICKESSCFSSLNFEGPFSTPLTAFSHPLDSKAFTFASLHNTNSSNATSPPLSTP